MSRINDALKRARDLNKKNTPAAAPPIAPVEIRKLSSREPNWVFLALIFLLIVSAFFFIAFAMANRTVRKIVNAPEIVATQEVESVSEPANPPPLAPLPAEIGPAAVTNVALPNPVPNETHVQGIFYDPAHPSAIVNDKTIFPGDMVDGMRVTKISRNSITLVGNGKTNTLIVGQ